MPVSTASKTVKLAWNAQTINTTDYPSGESSGVTFDYIKSCAKDFFGRAPLFRLAVVGKNLGYGGI